MDTSKFTILNCASIDFEYLHTNSTTHEFLFGAIAELVDNSRDAKADTLHIDYGAGQLSFLDDGCGMDKKEVESIISFGYSAKRMDPDMVGQYGNGLKSAAMRIGKDVLVLTKKEGLLTSMLISRTFLEDNNLRKVIVPTPSFLEDGTPYYETMDEMEKHTLETNIIHEYSPFTTPDELMSQFRRITTESGTLVICYNLRRIESGNFEMDFDTDLFDVRLTGHIPHREEERNSLRAYLAILYSNPRMRVFIRGEKVDTKRILSTLYKPRMYRYQARNLKACAEKELQECQKKVVELNDTVSRCRSEVADFEVKHPNFMSDNTLRIHYRTLVKAVDVAVDMLSASEKRLKKLARAKSNPSPLIFYFGLNIQHRNRYGCMVYNNGRMIKMYEKLASQKERNDRMLRYLGVVAIVDVPCSVLAPAHSKQSFENPREYAILMKAINDYMEQYWNDTAIDATPGGVANFWRPFGYQSMEWNAEPSNELEFMRKRYSSVGYSLQCDKCLKWRHLQFQQSYLTEGIPKDWNCSMNPNSLFRSCSKLEELPKIVEGRLMKLPDKPPIVVTRKDSKNSARSMAYKNSTARGDMVITRKRVPSPPPAQARRIPERVSPRNLRKQPSRRALPSAPSEDSSETDSSSRSDEKRQPARTRIAVPVPAPAKRSGPPSAKKSFNRSAMLIRQMERQKPVPEVEVPKSVIRIQPDEDDSSEDEAPPPPKRRLARTKASLTNGMLMRQPGPATAPEPVVNEPAPTAPEPVVNEPATESYESEGPNTEKQPQIEEQEEENQPSTGIKIEVNQPVISVLQEETNQPSSSSASTSTSKETDNMGNGNDTTIEDSNPMASKAHKAVSGEDKTTGLMRMLSEVLEFFRESSFPKIHFSSVDDALSFNVQAYFNAYREGLERLISEQVSQKMQKYMENSIKMMRWADPETADEINDENVLQRMDEFTRLI